MSEVAERDERGTGSPDEGLNRRIIAILEQDGRTPFSEIAATVGVSEGTIRNRVAALRENNLLRIVAVTDPVANDYRTDAIIAIRVAPGVAPAEVARRFEDDGRVVYVLWVAGRFDLIIEVVSDDPATLPDFLEAEIHSSADIAEAEVMPGLRNFKNQFLLKRNGRRANG